MKNKSFLGYNLLIIRLLLIVKLLFVLDVFSFAMEPAALVRLEADFSRESRYAVQDLLHFYDTLEQDDTVTQELKSTFRKQRSLLSDNFKETFGVVYVDNVGRNYFITSASVAHFSDFARVEYLSSGSFRKLGASYLIYRNKSIAIYLLDSKVNHLNKGITLGFNPTGDRFLASIYLYQQEKYISVYLDQVEDTLWKISDDSLSFIEGSPLLDDNFNILGIVVKDNFVATSSDIQVILNEAERIRPRATSGALERASLNLVDSVISENYDAFVTMFSAEVTTSVGIPVFLSALESANKMTRDNYISVLADKGPSALMNSMIGTLLIERFSLFDLPAFEQIKIDDLTSNTFELDTMITYSLNQQIYSVGWIYSSGLWRVNDLNSFHFIETRSVFRRIERNGIMLGMGYTFMSDIYDITNVHVALGYYHQLHRFFAISTEVNYHNLSYRIEDFQERVFMVNALFRSQLQMGLVFNSFNILIYSGLSLGLGVRVSGFLEGTSFQYLLVNRSRAIFNGGWFAGLEFGFSERWPLFLGMEGGMIGDFFSGKYLSINYNKGSRANAYYLRGYIKLRI